MIKSLKDKYIKEGILFENKLDFLKKAEKYSKQELINYQDEQLRKIIRHAYKYVPYYRDLFYENKLCLDDIKSQNDLWKIPILTKEDVKNNFKKLKSTKHPKRILNLAKTSGTTGSPLKIYRDMNSIILENAIVWRQWNWSGLNVGDNIAVLRGERIINPDRKKTPYWIFDKITHRLKLSPIHITDDTIPDYIEAIKSHECKVLQAYPSNAYVLALYMVKHNIKLKLNAVFTSSEPVYSFQRTVIEEAFDCKIWDFYGMAERVTSSSECSSHSGLHINEEYGITEFLNGENLDSNKGILIGTSLHNYGMPLIRYKTSDFAEIQVGECQCGMKHRVIKPIESRLQDMIITNDGKYLSPSGLTLIIKELPNIKESQIIQNTRDDYEIKIVEEGEFSRDTELILRNKMEEVLGDTANIDIKLVNEIERTKNGKFRWIISRVGKGA